jgi:hypothetical protein
MKVSAMVQPIYDAIQQAIAMLSREDAVTVLDEVTAHCEAKRDRIEDEIDDDE